MWKKQFFSAIAPDAIIWLKYMHDIRLATFGGKIGQWEGSEEASDYRLEDGCCGRPERFVPFGCARIVMTIKPAKIRIWKGIGD